MSTSKSKGLQIHRAVIAFALSAACSIPSGAAAASTEPTLIEEMRVKSIGYKLARANSNRCISPRMMTGLHLHDESGYDQAARGQIRAFYGLGGGFGLLDVVKDSAASRAGLMPRDEIIGIDGVAADIIAPRKVAKKGSYARTELFADYLERTLQKGAANLAVRRGGTKLTVALTGDAGCGGEFAIVPGSMPNARADGKYVGVSQSMVEMADDDSELAFVIAHEMGHNLMSHPKKLGKFATLFAELGLGTSRVRNAEIEADDLGVKIIASVGYDLNAPERILRKLSRLMPINLSLSHPGFGRRIASVNQARASLAPASAGRIAVNLGGPAEDLKANAIVAAWSLANTQDALGPATR